MLASNDQRQRLGGRPGLPHRLFAQQLRSALLAERRRRDRARLRRRVQDRLRHPCQRPHHRLRLDGHLQSQVRQAQGGGARRHQRRHQGGRHRRAPMRRRRDHPGGHGILRDRARRQDIPK